MNKELSAKEMLLIGLIGFLISVFWKGFIGSLIGVVGIVFMLFSLAKYMRDRRTTD